VDENPAFTDGTIIPVPTQNTRIAAFLRIHHDKMYLCIFNFPNPHIDGQQAVPRKFNFLIGGGDFDSSTVPILPDRIYEVIERYNNAEGRTRREKKEFWSGHELMHLGFGGVLEPVSSHVFELADKTDSYTASRCCWIPFCATPLWETRPR